LEPKEGGAVVVKGAEEDPNENPVAGAEVLEPKEGGVLVVEGAGEDPNENPVAGEKGEDCVEEEEKGKPDIVEALSFCLYEINCLGFSVLKSEGFW
jgi:hypothetical protein